MKYLYKTTAKLAKVIVLLLVFINVGNAQNVGIGTTGPDEKLTVAGTIKSAIISNGNFLDSIVL